MSVQHSAAPFEPTATVREGRPDDVGTVVDMVRELAEYERAADQARITPEQLHRAVFEGAAPGGHPAAYLLVAEEPGADGPVVVGFALWFLNYSTWEGVHGIYLEDLYVRPASRGTGAGRALLTALARTAVERGYARVDWSVLTWNEPAIGFYRRIGAIPLEEWRTYRLTGSALASLAR
ncbi:GNAT family N-acetyltransferase [Microlunatus flavus]|nr:GNAT family N-acetyltransferase [Microlunatus flavus]